MQPSRTASPEHGIDVGSFRDPDSRVYLEDGAVYRVLSEDGWRDWEALAATPLVADDRLIASEPVELDALPELTAGPAAGALKHERIPWISYPYEWPFSMLKDAALLQLELGRSALQHDLTLKDASAYNVQWRGAKPVFVDVGSFERLREGEPWAGYRQFCMLYLYPLMLAGLPGHAVPRLAARLARRHRAGEARAVLSARRRGVLTHVVLHARLEARYADAGGREVKRELKRAGFGKALLDANLRKLAQARQPARVQARPHGLDRVRAHQHLQRRRGRPQGRVRARRSRTAPRRPRLGPRLQRRHLLARGGRARRHRRRRRRRPRHRRRALPRPARRGGRTESCRW